MRVLQLGPVPPPHGGVQANLSAIHERLQMRGEESLLVGITRSSETTAALKPEPNVFRPRSLKELFQLLFSLRPDILHLHFGGDFTLRLAALAFVCSLVPRAKTVLTFHSGGFATSPAGVAAKFWSRRGFVVRRLDKIIAVNAEIVSVFQKYGVPPAKIALVAPHVLKQPDPAIEIPELLKSFADSHSPLLLTTSWLEKHYDLPLQIKVLGRLKKDFPTAGLLIAGAGELENELRQLVEAQNYAADVLLAGDVPHGIVLHLMKRADILLRTTHFDGDAISVREGLHLGTPVVTTDYGIRPPGVALFKIGDLDGLERAIREQLQSGKHLSPGNEDGWENIDAVLQIYEELLPARK